MSFSATLEYLTVIAGFASVFTRVANRPITKIVCLWVSSTTVGALWCLEEHSEKQMLGLAILIFSVVWSISLVVLNGIVSSDAVPARSRRTWLCVLQKSVTGAMVLTGFYWIYRALDTREIRGSGGLSAVPPGLTDFQGGEFFYLFGVFSLVLVIFTIAVTSPFAPGKRRSESKRAIEGTAR